MWRSFTRCLSFALVVAATGCAGASSGGATDMSAPRSQRDLITKEQIEATHQKDAYSVVASLRSNWLRERGSDSITRDPTKVQVYLDNVRMGTVDALKSIRIESVEYIQHYDSNAASARSGNRPRAGGDLRVDAADGGAVRGVVIGTTSSVISHGRKRLRPRGARAPGPVSFVVDR